MDFGERLKLLRYEKELTQDDLGYILNLTKSCICCYENGTRKPSIDILIQMATYFRVSIDYLLGMDSFNSYEVIRFTKKDKKIIDLIKDYPITYQKIIDNPKDCIQKIRKIFE